MTQPVRPAHSRVAGACIVLLSVVSLLAGSLTATAATPEQPATGSSRARLNGDLGAWAQHAERSARRSVFVELDGPGAYGTATTQGHNAAQARSRQISSEATSLARAARRADPAAKTLFSTRNAVGGLAVTLDAAGLTALSARVEVKAIYPIAPKTRTNAGAAQVDGALAQWRDTGRLGDGVKVGVIDTGIDYTHADFAGPGTETAFQAARQSSDFTPTAAVAGGYDFAGDDYTGDNEPQPDDNPLDCDGHGTHVAGTIAGRGVKADGSTFTGDYSSLTGKALYDLKIGPGVAPHASLYALRVFGCAGSTNLTSAALDWALDPNGDGRYDDHLDVVNLSLGSIYGSPDDFDSEMVDRLAGYGVLSVIAAGNDGDLTDVSSSPGNATRGLTVASAVDPYRVQDAVRVDAPSSLGRLPGQFSVAYDMLHASPVSGSVVTLSAAGNRDGCDPLTEADRARVAGKIVWLEWDSSDVTRRCGSAGRAANVVEGGAIGALFSYDLPEFTAGITGSDEIPVLQLTSAATAQARPFAEAGTLRVTFDPALRGSVKSVDPSLRGTVSSFSSRGGHQSGSAVKPEITAPGDTISSALSGSGTQAAVESGTSMATPAVAGIAALVREEHRDFSVEQLKAAVVNSAQGRLTTGPGRSGEEYGPARVGAGEANADAAVRATTLALGDPGTGSVALGFGAVTVPVNTPTTISKSVALTNTGSVMRDYRVSYRAITTQPGVSYSAPARISVPAHSTRQFRVTMTVDPNRLRRVRERSMAATQANPLLRGANGAAVQTPRQYLPSASGDLEISSTQPSSSGSAQTEVARVPVYATAKPASTTTARLLGAGTKRLLVQTGSGVRQGHGSSAYRSIMSVVALGASSPRLHECTDGVLAQCLPTPGSRSGDLRYVGAGVDADTVWFGLNTWAQWTSPNQDKLDVVIDIDSNRDGETDRVVLLAPLPDTDLYQSLLYDQDGQLLGTREVNFRSAEHDTNLFDTDTVLLPVDRAKLLPGATSLSYTVRTYTSAGPLDGTAPVTLNLASAPVRTARPWYDDQRGTRISVRVATGADVLVLHLHGQPGRRAQVLLAAAPPHDQALGAPPLRPVGRPATTPR